MHRAKTLFIIAILVMIVPHLGLTNIMEQITLFVIGLIILIFSYGLYFENKNKKEKPIKNINRKVNLHTPISHSVNPKKKMFEEESDVIVIRKEARDIPEDNFNI